MAHNNSEMSITSLAADISGTLFKLLTNQSILHNNTNSNHTGNGTNPGQPIQSGFSTLYIAFLCVSAIIFIPGILANGLILFALFKIEKLRVASNYLIGSLAFADLLMIAVMAAFVFSDVFHIKFPLSIASFLWPSFDGLIGSASILSLAAVSFDRATAVVWPLHYHEKINNRQTTIAIRCIWGYSVGVFVFGMLRCAIHSKVYRDAFLYCAYFFSYGMPCAVIIASYLFILLATIRSVKVSRSIERSVLHATMGDDEAQKRRRRRKLRLQEIKIASNLTIILLPFVAGWGFYFGTHFYESVTGSYKRSNLYEFFMILVPWINSTVNPLVYLMSTAALRKGCMKLLCRRRYYALVARETVMTNLQSKRCSAIEKIDLKGSIASEEKISFCGKLKKMMTRKPPQSFDIEAISLTDQRQPSQKPHFNSLADGTDPDPIVTWQNIEIVEAEEERLVTRPFRAATWT